MIALRTWCRTLATILAASFLFASSMSAQDRLRVGVWNIEKLSTTAKRGFPELTGDDSLSPRTNADLRKMAEYLRDELEVDALMVTEVDADSPLSTETRPQSEQLNAVASEMGPNWKYFLGRTGEDMRLGLLFNTDRVRLQKLINLEAPEFSVSGKDVLDRDPFIAWISAVEDGEARNDLILICVHLKSQQKPFRDNRMAAIAKVIGDFTNPKVRNELTLPSQSEEPETLILGDCNDSSFKSSGFRYMFDYLEGVGFAHLHPASGDYPPTRVNGSQIDHIFATEKIVDESMIEDSFHVHHVPESERENYRESLSDHFPVTVDIRIESDTDFTFREALATTDPALRKERMDFLQEAAFERVASDSATSPDADDQDDGEFEVRAEIRDRDFEEILAPVSDTSGGHVEATGRRERGTGVPAESPTETADTPEEGITALAIPEREAMLRNVPRDRFAKSDRPVVFLDQNWTPAEAVEFYSLRQGSPLMRRDFFNILEQPDSTDLFRDSDYLSRFGFLPRRPHEGNTEGYPIGFTGDTAIELTCAACHTSKLTYGEKEYWIDGSQAMTDVESWLTDLVRAIKLTVADAPDLSTFAANVRIRLDQNTKFGRFVRRLTGATSPSVAQAQAILNALKADLARRQRYNDYNSFGRQFTTDSERGAATGHSPYGFGRLDALGAILNQACAEHLDAPANARIADAPVNYPAIWDAPQHVHVQWNGAVDNTARFGPLGRNAGQVIGVFGLVETEDTNIGYDSSIAFDAIERAEELVTKLWSPSWPSEFGFDENKAAAGEEVYRANCIQCHAIIDRDDPHRRANDVLVPINEVYGGEILGTDGLTARNWQDRTARTGRLSGRLYSLPFRGRFPDDPGAKIPARDILSHMVFNAIARSYVPWRDELTIEDEEAERTMTFSATAEQETLMRYKARPLNGVWSTAPYLHNGSVQNMVELLTPPSERKTTFRVGTSAFDPQTLGYEDAGPFEFDTTLPGNHNSGHAYGSQLSAEQQDELLEFIKSL